MLWSISHGAGGVDRHGMFSSHSCPDSEDHGAAQGNFLHFLLQFPLGWQSQPFASPRWQTLGWGHYVLQGRGPHLGGTTGTVVSLSASLASLRTCQNTPSHFCPGHFVLSTRGKLQDDLHFVSKYRAHWQKFHPHELWLMSFVPRFSQIIEFLPIKSKFVKWKDGINSWILKEQNPGAYAGGRRQGKGFSLLWSRKTSWKFWSNFVLLASYPASFPQHFTASSGLGYLEK